MRTARSLLESLARDWLNASGSETSPADPADDQEIFDRLSESLQAHQVQAGCVEVHRLLDPGQVIGTLPLEVRTHALACDLCLLRLVLELPGAPGLDLPGSLQELADDLSPLVDWRVEAVERVCREAAERAGVEAAGDPSRGRRPCPGPARGPRRPPQAARGGRNHR